MFYNVLELKDLVDYKENVFDKNVLLEHNDSSLSAIALKKHEVLENHISVCDACALVYDGEAEFHFAAETYLKSNYDIKMSTLRAAGAIEGKDLVVMDSETFEKISKYLFKEDTPNVVDSVSVELTVFKDEVDLYPFLIAMDKYKAIIGGRHNINEDLDFNYHISLASPLRLGLDIKGTFDDLKFGLTPTRYKNLFVPERRNDIQERTLKLMDLINTSLKEKVVEE